MNNNFNITGEIHHISDEQKFSEKFKKRDFVIRFSDGAYEQHIKFQLINDRCDLIDSYKTGQEVKVHFNLAGREYNKDGQTVYFTNLTAWRLEKGGGDDQATPAMNEPVKLEKTASGLGAGSGDDLPF